MLEEKNGTDSEAQKLHCKDLCFIMHDEPNTFLLNCFIIDKLFYNWVWDQDSEKLKKKILN